MSVFERTVTATIGTSAGSPLTVLDYRVTLDEGWAPYGQADMVIKRPSDVLLLLLDPASRSRIIVTTTSTLGGTRVFNMSVVARQVYHLEGTVGLSLATDESILQDFAHVGIGPNNSNGPLQASVRAIVQNVLTTALGATTTVAETNDYDFTTTYGLSNLWPFLPTSSASATKAVPAFATLATSSTAGFIVRPASTTVNESYVAVEVSVTAGKTYTLSATEQQSAVQTGSMSPRARSLYVILPSDSGSGSAIGSPQAPNSTAASRISVTFAVPEGSTGKATVRMYAGTLSGGGDAWFRDLMLVEGNGRDWATNVVIPYFDGSTAASTLYTYAWSGDVGLSTSSRTPRINRSPEALSWLPGVTAWDFLRPIVEAAGLRLWCDEARVWHLTTPTYNVPGYVIAQAAVNLYSAQDLMSRTASQSTGVPLMVDAVIIRYRWTDQFGIDRERYDTATLAGYTKPFLVERDSPFPGVGAAAYLLNRYRLRRRQVPATAALDVSVQPGQYTRIIPGDGTTLNGYLDAVTLDFGADVMTLRSKDLA